MSEVYQDAAVSLPVAAEAIHEGYIYKDDGSYRMTKITAKGDTAIAIAKSSTMDAQLATARTMPVGEEWDFYMLGCQKIVNVAFAGSNTVVPFAPIYLDDSTDGMASVTPSTSQPIGHAMVKKSTAASSGDLLPVLLDTKIGAANV
jgi:hypothetical protein